MILIGSEKQGRPDWTFPKTKLALGWMLIKQVFGGGFIEAIRSITDLSGKKLRAGPRTNSHWERLGYYLTAAAVIGYFQIWTQVLLFWFLPAFTVLTVILRIRSIAEHFGVEGTESLNMSRNTQATFFERCFFAPHHSGYHLDHHLYPSVPYYNLPKLHVVLKVNREYIKKAHQSDSLFRSRKTSMLAEITAENEYGSNGV